MDLGIEMYEVYLIQVAGLVQEWLMELGWQNYSRDKNKQSPAQVLGNNEHNPNQS